MRGRREPYEDRRRRRRPEVRRRSVSSEEEEEADDPRAARRRALARLRAEADEEEDTQKTRDVQQSDAWRRMLAEREAQRTAAAPPSSDEGMDISGDEQDAEPTTEGMMTAEQEVMLSMMGFASFDSTKNKPTEGGLESGVRKASRRKYRQYMNRKGGFNRPLSPAF